jgi:hypothetical protein
MPNLTLANSLVQLLRANATVPDPLLTAVELELRNHGSSLALTPEQQAIMDAGEAAAKGAIQQIQPTMAGPNADQMIKGE